MRDGPSDRLHREESSLGVRLAASLREHAEEQARRLPLSHSGEPRRLEPDSMGEWERVEPSTQRSTARTLLGRDEMVGGGDCEREGGFGALCEVLLVVTESDLRKRNVPVAFTKPDRRPCTVGGRLRAEVDIVTAKALGIDAASREQPQAFRAAEKARIHDSSTRVPALLHHPAPDTGHAKIHVLTIVDGVGAGGGAESTAAALVGRIDPKRFERTLCVTRPSRARLLDTLREAGVNIVELDRRGRLDVGAWASFIRYVRANPVDILHSHKFGSNVWSALAARVLPISRLITHEHSWSFSGDRRRVLLDRYVIAPKASAMVAVSAEDARRMNAVEGIPRDKIRLIPNGIEVQAPADPTELRKILGIDPSTPIVGFVGSLRPEKRVDVIVDAVAELSRAGSGPGLCLAVIGSGPEEAALRARATALGIADSVRFLGFRSDAPDLAAGFDVAVLASEREGAPLALLEYMGLGRAIVATSVGGIPEIVHDGVHALLVPPRDAPALATAVGTLLGDPTLRMKLGRAAADRQVSEFGLDVMTRRIEDLYLEVLGLTS